MLKILLFYLSIGILLASAQTTIDSDDFFEEDELDKFVDKITNNNQSSSVYQTVNHIVIETHKNNGEVSVHISDPMITIEDGNGERLWVS